MLISDPRLINWPANSHICTCKTFIILFADFIKSFFLKYIKDFLQSNPNIWKWKDWRFVRHKEELHCCPETFQQIFSWPIPHFYHKHIAHAPMAKVLPAYPLYILSCYPKMIMVQNKKYLALIKTKTCDDLIRDFSQTTWGWARGLLLRDVCDPK